MIERGRVLSLVELDVELQTAHAREVVLARIEEHAFEERSGGVERWRIAGTQLAVDLDQRLFGLADRIAAQRVGDDVADVVALGEEDFHLGDARLHDLVQLVGGELVVGLEQNLAGRGVDHVGSGHRTVELRGFDLDPLDLGSTQRLQDRRSDLAAGVRDLIEP